MYILVNNENDDSDLEVYFNNENEYLHIPNVQQTEDYDPALSDWSTQANSLYNVQKKYDNLHRLSNAPHLV